MKRKPLVYIAGEAVELPSNQGLDFDDSNFVHITGQETITGMKIFDVPPRSSFTIENPNDASQKIPNTAWVQQAILAAKTNTLIYKGIVNNTHPLPDSNYEIGWVYKVAKAGDYAGQPCEVWDTIVCVATNGNDNDWYVIQANIDGYVIGTGSTTAGDIAIFTDSVGKVITGSGINITDINNKIPVFNSVSTASERLEYWDTTPTAGSTKPVTSYGIYSALANKISTYSNNPDFWDITPRNGSNKPVTSDGIYDALEDKLDKMAVDDYLSTSSTNPVQNKVITKELNKLKNRIAALEAALGECCNEYSGGTTPTDDTETGVSKFSKTDPEYYAEYWFWRSGGDSGTNRAKYSAYWNGNLVVHYDGSIFTDYENANAVKAAFETALAAQGYALGDYQSNPNRYCYTYGIKKLANS